MSWPPRPPAARKLAEETLALKVADGVAMARRMQDCARELLAALDREADLKEEVDGMARAPYGEYQNMRERAEAAEARADALEAALREIAELAGYGAAAGSRIAREALAAHGKKP